jgi:hypothetical protein
MAAKAERSAGTYHYRNPPDLALSPVAAKASKNAPCTAAVSPDSVQADSIPFWLVCQITAGMRLMCNTDLGRGPMAQCHLVRSGSGLDHFVDLRDMVG